MIKRPKFGFRYHVPRSWLKPEQNLLVVFEEVGGNPSRISIVKRLVTSVCADVSEFHPTFKNWHITARFHTPKVHLSCDPGQYISSIKFASFGTPLGTCGSYQQGACHAPTSRAILEKVLRTNYCQYYLVFCIHIARRSRLWINKVTYTYFSAEMHRKAELRCYRIQQQLRRPMSKYNEAIIG